MASGHGLLICQASKKKRRQAATGSGTRSSVPYRKPTTLSSTASHSKRISSAIWPTNTAHSETDNRHIRQRRARGRNKTVSCQAARGWRREIVRNAEKYSAQSTRVLSAEYAAGFRMSSVGQAPAVAALGRRFFSLQRPATSFLRISPPRKTPQTLPPTTVRRRPLPLSTPPHKRPRPERPGMPRNGTLVNIYCLNVC